MKRYIFALSILIFGLSSCQDFLELEPEFQISESSFYQTVGDFETATIGNYAELQNIYDVNILYLTELTTDNAEITWTSPTTAEAECDELNLTSNNTFVNAIWNLGFKTIIRSNTILEKIESADVEATHKAQYRGEAHFLRALNYFNLVRLFGDLPLVSTSFRSPEGIAEFDMSRRPVEEIYNLIIADLEQAATNLQGLDLGTSRASADAATTLLAKVLLTRGDYAGTIRELDKVIAGSRYTLVEDFASLFGAGNEYSAESIFEIEYLSGNVGEGNGFSSVFTPPSFNMAIFPGNMAGSGRIVPTQDIRQAFANHDLRREASIMDSLLLQDGTYEDTQYGLKFVDFTTGITGDGGVNFIVLRYADVLLMYAEALNESGQTEDAHSHINAVRSRAGLIPLSGLDQTALRLALEQERRLEFLGEGHRWFDLLRTGRAISVMNDYFTSIGLDFSLTENELLMPIPQREIDIDPNLSQNPGY